MSRVVQFLRQMGAQFGDASMARYAKLAIQDKPQPIPTTSDCLSPSQVLHLFQRG